jgi:hypothetical protein
MDDWGEETNFEHSIISVEIPLKLNPNCTLKTTIKISFQLLFVVFMANGSFDQLEKFRYQFFINV